MALSKKHYVAIARTFSGTVEAYGLIPAGEGGDPASEVAYALASGLADVFAADNPRFDRARFLKAAGVTEE